MMSEKKAYGGLMKLLYVCYIILYACQWQVVVAQEEQDIVISPTGTTTSSLPPQNLINDDYCDDIKQGLDERNTSACSFYSTYRSSFSGGVTFDTNEEKGKFLCSKDGQHIIALPTSRVHDGICDCCDGSDEAKHPFVDMHCPNTCELHLSTLRREALTLHRNIQSGLRSRTERVNSFQLQRQMEKRSYESLLQERKDLFNLLANMQYLLAFEKIREEELRWVLLQERLYHCSVGYEDICHNFFYDKFYNTQELLDEGIPEKYLNPKKRFVYEYSASERDYLTKVKGLERVQQSICYARELLPDDDARIFTRIHDYMSFMNSPGGKVARERRTTPTATKKYIKEQTLFGKYLENGEKGYRLAILTIWETVALLVSPVTVVVHVIHSSVQYVINEWIWKDIVFYAQVYRHDDFKSLPPALQEATSSRGDSPMAPKQADASFLYHFSRMCRYVLMIEEEGSLPYEVYYNYLDYSRYSVLNAYLESMNAQLTNARFVLDIIQYTPYIYYHYYISNQGKHLPPRRHACLLRQGIQNAEDELLRLEDKIAEEEAMRQLLQLEKFGGASDEITSSMSTRGRRVSSTSTSSKDKGKGKTWFDQLVESFGNLVVDMVMPKKVLPISSKGRSTTSKASKQTAPQLLDFGVDGSWESVFKHCTSTIYPPPSQSETTRYNYTFCLFDEIQQASLSDSSKTSLGSFCHWGAYNIFNKQPDAKQRTRNHQEAHVMQKLTHLLQEIQQRKQQEDQEFYQSQKMKYRKGVFDGMLVDINALVQSFSSLPSTITQSISSFLPQDVASRQWLEQQYLYVQSLDHPLLSYLTDVLYHSLTPTDLQIRDMQLKQQLQQYYSMQVYDDGTPCNAKPSLKRRTTVTFECGGDYKITEINEVEMCIYAMKVSIPLVCTPYLEEESLKRLETLGVFGFAKSSTSTTSSNTANRGNAAGTLSGFKP